MATLSLNTNLPSLQTQRQLARSTAALSKNYERLSSGLRVSRASDDAAGLAVASGLNVDSRVFSQGLRNISDGISVTNIAEGALNELSNIVIRLQELSEQAANGTVGAKQRGALDAEAQALSKEYSRIAKTAEFNGRKLFDGSIQGLSLQVGYGENGRLNPSLGGRMGTGTFAQPISFDIGNVVLGAALGDLNGDGALDIVTGSTSISVLLCNGDGTFRAKSDYTAGSFPGSIALGDLNGDGILDIAAANYVSDDISVLLGNGDGTFRVNTDYAGSSPRSIALGDVTGDGVLDIVASNYTAHTVSVFAGKGDGTFNALFDLSAPSTPNAVALGDMNADGVLDIVTANATGSSAYVFLANGDGTFKARVSIATASGPESLAVGDINDDGVLDIAVITSSYTSVVSVLIGNGDGSFQAKRDYSIGPSTRAVALGDTNGDGALDILITNQDTKDVSLLLGNGDGGFEAAANFGTGHVSVSVGDLNRDGVLDIMSTDQSSDKAMVMLGDTRDGVSPLLQFSLKTRTDAKWALEVMKQKLVQLSQQRGIIGSNQSRLAIAAANLQVERENYDAASSQITDVDVAVESAQLVRTQILQQSSSAILGQANQAPALALKLLSG